MPPPTNLTPLRAWWDVPNLIAILQLQDTLMLHASLVPGCKRSLLETNAKYRIVVSGLDDYTVISLCQDSGISRQLELVEDDLAHDATFVEVPLFNVEFEL